MTRVRWTRLTLNIFNPNRPTQNAFIERFNGYDYNHKRPHDNLGKISAVKYAKLNSSGASSGRIKNNNFTEILEN